MNHLFQALATAADGAFVINQEQHIVYWNQAAQDVLGYIPAEVADQPCREVLAGCNDQGRSICHEHCRAAVKSFSGGTVTNFDIRVRTKANGPRWVNMSTFTFPADGSGNGRVLVHLFRDVTQKKHQEQFIDQVLAAAKTLQAKPLFQTHSIMPKENETTGLTDREREVLSLLTQGLNTNDIAHILSISPSTVRNHVRNILQKLHVHNRLEAVIYALKHGLVARE